MIMMSLSDMESMILHRYKEYTRQWIRGGKVLSSQAAGHACEASWVLITMFGWTDKRLRAIVAELEKEEEQ